MSVEQAKEIVELKDITTKEKRALFLQALQVLAGSAFKQQNQESNMDKEQAYKILAQVIANINTTAQQHQIMQEALRILKEGQYGDGKH